MTLSVEEIEDMRLDPSDELMRDDETFSHLLIAPMYERRVKPFLGFAEDDGVSWVDTYAIIEENRVTTLRSVFVDNVNHTEEELEVKITNIPEMEMIFKSLDEDGELSDEMDAELAVAAAHEIHERESEEYLKKKHEYLQTINRLTEFMDTYYHEDFVDYGEDISSVIRTVEETPEAVIKTLLDHIEETDPEWILGIGGTECDGVFITRITGSKEYALSYMEGRMKEEIRKTLMLSEADEIPEDTFNAPVDNGTPVYYGHNQFHDHHTDYHLYRVDKTDAVKEEA